MPLSFRGKAWFFRSFGAWASAFTRPAIAFHDYAAFPAFIVKRHHFGIQSFSPPLPLDGLVAAGHAFAAIQTAGSSGSG